MALEGNLHYIHNQAVSHIRMHRLMSIIMSIKTTVTQKRDMK